MQTTYSDRPSARRRRRQHRLPDRRVAHRHTRGPPLDRLSPTPPPATRARPRRLPDARRNRCDAQERRLPAWTTDEGPRHADWLTSACRPPARRPTPRPDQRCDGVNRRVRRRHTPRCSHRDLGDRLRRRPNLDPGSDLRRSWSPDPPARHHSVARPVLHRPAVAAHARLSAARLGQARCGAPRKSPRNPQVACGYRSEFGQASRH